MLFGYISFLCLFTHQTAVAQLNPDFTFTQTSVCLEQGGILVNFINNSASSIGTFTSQWNFGDGSIPSNETNPGKTYDKPGVYKVVLTISAAGQSASITKTIIIYSAPKVVFKVDKNQGCIPLNVLFTDQTQVNSLTDTENGNVYTDKIISWKWDFGDNKTSLETVPSTSHTYLDPDFKKVKLEVETALGCIATYITPNEFINVFRETKASFVLAPANSCQFPVTISASNASINAKTYKWSISGTSPASIADPLAENAEITFAQSGNYNVKLDAVGPDGCTSSYNLNYVVAPNPVQNSFSSPDIVCENVDILFTNTSNPDPINNSWSINGSPFSIAKNLTYKFPSPGSYTVRLDALLGTCQTYSEKTIVVNASPTVDFSADVRGSCNFPLDVRFSATTSSDVVKRVWNFGDNTSATELPPFKLDTLHVYKGAGSFGVSLAVTNDKNCTITKTVPNYILIQPPVITKSNLPDSGCAPLTITPDVRFNGSVVITSWEWTITNANGDVINTVFGQNPGPQTFSDSGRYKIALRVITNTGCEKDFSWPIKVGVVPDNFDFISTPTDTCASLSFALKYIGSPITGLKWMFSDGDSSILTNPSKKFKKLGQFDVTLTAFINGCAKTVTKSNYINVKGVIASFAALNDCSNSLEKVFSDGSTGNITQWNWDFGDGTTTSYATKVPTMTHVYTKTGQFNVKLKVSGDGCDFETVQSVFVTNESSINFDLSKLPVCVSDTFVTLLGLAENSKMIKSYDWNYGCGFTGATGTQNPKIDLTKLCNYQSNLGRGNYPMQVKIIDQNNCVYFSPIKNIFIGGPITDYAAISPITGCQNLPVQFQDKSLGDGTNQIVSRTWDFGDGSTPIDIPAGPIEHIFSGVGKFSIKLTTTDIRGCVAVKTKVIVNTSAPVFDFISTQIASCPNKDVQFQVNTAEVLTSYVWDLGDGRVSFVANPKVSYSITSKKTISLTVKDVVGCVSTLIKREYIEIGLPIAKFNVLKDTTDCPPFNAEFTFDGSFVEKYEWDFGDGAVSNQPHPRNIYNKSGVFPVNLKVTSPGGCIANATPRNIVIQGPSATINFNPTICEPFDAVFNVTSTNAKYVLLDYGDGVIQDSLPYKTQYAYRYADTGYYQPKIFVENDKGCRVFIPTSLGIRAIGILPVFKSDINFYCDNGTVKFTDLSLSNEKFKSWQWDFGDGGVGTGNVSSHFYSRPGIYNVKVKATTLSGCSDSLTRQKMIEIQTRPDVEIFSAKLQFCEEDSVQFEAREITPNNSPVVKWFWDFTNGNSSDQKIPVIQEFRKAGSYPMRLYATNDRGCIDTVFKTYVVNPLPPIFAGIDTFLCLNKPIQLKPSGASTFEWIAGPNLSCTNCIIPTINPANNAVYIVKGTSALGCVAYDSVAVKVVQPSKIIASQDVSICIGESVRLNASGTEIITWSPITGLSGFNIQSPIAKPNTTTTYTATGRDSYGCFITSDDIVVTVNTNPTVNAGNDTTMMAGYPLQLKPTYSPDVTRVVWVPSIFLSCYDCKTPVSTPMYSATYTVFAYTANNCMSKDVINVYATCTKENLFIPNTFSPNGDGSNEVFYPRGRGIQKIKSFKIFNRWGRLIHLSENFFANDQSAGWEGIKDGKYVTPDVYVYMIDLVCENGNIITLKGDVTLIR